MVDSLIVVFYRKIVEIANVVVDPVLDRIVLGLLRINKVFIIMGQSHIGIHEFFMAARNSIVGHRNIIVLLVLICQIQSLFGNLQRFHIFQVCQQAIGFTDEIINSGSSIFYIFLRKSQAAIK
ncbi:hypothetical protein D9M72_506020 [compost metagenome]